MNNTRFLKPKVSEVKAWYPVESISSRYAIVSYADIDEAFMRVSGKGFRTKYFYGETAWHDARRYAGDQYNPHL